MLRIFLLSTFLILTISNVSASAGRPDLKSVKIPDTIVDPVRRNACNLRFKENKIYFGKGSSFNYSAGKVIVEVTVFGKKIVSHKIVYLTLDTGGKRSYHYVFEQVQPTGGNQLSIVKGLVDAKLREVVMNCDEQLTYQHRDYLRVVFYLAPKE